MNSSAPLIGFDRFVQLAWCEAMLDVANGIRTIDDLRSLIAITLPGSESQRKTIDILKRLWLKPFPTLIDFVSRGLQLHQKLRHDSVLALTWGSATAYPFFGKTSEISGRLLSLQGDCSIKEIQRRMAEAYGDRNGIERAVARVLQTQADWAVLARQEETKRVLKIDSRPIDDDKLIGWLIEAAVRYAGKPISVASLQSLSVLFPFVLTRPLGYVVSTNPNLYLRSEGPSNQFVALRTVI